MFRLNDSPWVAPVSSQQSWRRPWRTSVQPADPRRQSLDWGDAIDTVRAQQDLDPPEEYDPREGPLAQGSRSLREDVTRSQLRAPGRDDADSSGSGGLDLVRSLLEMNNANQAMTRSAAARQRGDWGDALYNSAIATPIGALADVSQTAGTLGMMPVRWLTGPMRAAFTRMSGGVTPLRAGASAQLGNIAPETPGLLEALFSDNGPLADAVRAGRRPMPARQSWMGRNEQYGPPNPYLPDFAR